MEEVEYEQRLLKIDECFLYKVPPLKQAVGHRAEGWDLGNPTLTGSLEIIGKGQVLEIRLFDDSMQIVAKCPVRCNKGAPPVEVIVDAVVDSSRYFVLRCEDEKKRHAYVGIGFRERDIAFNFKACIFDFKAKIDRENKALADAENRRRRKKLQDESASSENDHSDEYIPDEPNPDLVLKKPIKLSLGAHPFNPKTSVSASPPKDISKAASIPRLKPPPSFVAHQPPPALVSPAKDDDDDDFGDFEEAAPPASS